MKKSLVLSGLQNGVRPNQAATRGRPQGARRRAEQQPAGQPFEAHMLERTRCFHFILLWDFWDKSVADATTLLPSLLAPSVSALYYVLSGQHIFSAASRIASSRAKEHLPIPWCLSYQDGGKVYGNGNML